MNGSNAKPAVTEKILIMSCANNEFISLCYITHYSFKVYIQNLGRKGTEKNKKWEILRMKKMQSRKTNLT